jgi:hypothetical protein
MELTQPIDIAQLKDRYAFRMLQTFADDHGIHNATQVSSFVEAIVPVAVSSAVKSALKVGIYQPASVVPMLTEMRRENMAVWDEFHAAVIYMVERRMAEEAQLDQHVLDACAMMGSFAIK